MMPSSLLAATLLCALFAHGTSLAIAAPAACCVDATTKPLSPAAIANFNCGTLTDFGEERCRAVWGGGVCAWVASELCSPTTACQRVSKYEVHFGQRIDVGECRGPCSTADSSTCKPRTFAPIQLPGGTVMMVRECECSTCAARPKTVSVEITAGECDGKCAGQAQTSRVCTAGVPDNFSGANGPEPASPSAAILATAAPQCISGFTPNFDTFQADRCLAHTFTNCLVNGPCPLRAARVRFCLRAANVILTSTDHLNLGANGVILFNIPLPTLNGGTWNVNQELCTVLDLSNLPNGGANILPQIEAAGQLDFYVNDDTAVDFVNLEIDYQDCTLCAPRVSVVNTLYTLSGAQDIVDVKDCTCVDNMVCHREPLFRTFFPGTIFEATLDVGQCIGGCTASKTLCRPAFSSKRELKAPEGTRIVEIIERCACL